MLQQKFINRKSELKFLEKKYAERRPQLIILYGRRRIGKTSLIRYFLEKKKRWIYLLCSRDSIAENIKRFKEAFSVLTGKDYFLKLNTTSFFDLFKMLVEELGNKRFIIVIDEFPYLIELNPGIVSVFQKIWDELLINSNIYMILCGSSIGMMETEVLGYKSPLYGRRTGSWNVGKLGFEHIHEFFPKYDIDSCFMAWAVCGGVPYYLTLFDPALSVWKNIKQKILHKGEVLYDEPENILRQEFREPRVYGLVLKYLAAGYNSFGVLSNASGIEKGNLSKYLSVLLDLCYVKHEVPLFQKKKGRFVIADNFFEFWFKFVLPNKEDLELESIDLAARRIKDQLDQYFGKKFEDLIIDLIRRKLLFSSNFDYVGRWWHKGVEIDVTCFNKKQRFLLVGECKWQKKVNAKRLLTKLEEKLNLFPHKYEKVKFFIVARSFSKRTKDCVCLDLKDIWNEINKKIQKKIK